MSKNRKVAVTVLLLIAAIALGVLAYLLTTSYIRKQQYKQLKEDVFVVETTPATEQTSEVTTTAATDETATAIEETTTETTKEPYVSPIDFDELEAINGDIYAWIDIPDTDISYPVLQHPTEFEYYLRKGLDCQYSNDGSLFTQPGNAKNMSDYNTIIYGHNLRSLAMFGTLKYYRDLTYLEEHREIKIYTREGEFSYTVFAAVTYSDKLITAYYDFTIEEDRQGFLDSLDDINDLNSYILDDVNVDSNSILLTLSTCNSDKSQRFLVVAVLTDVQN